MGVRDADQILLAFFMVGISGFIVGVLLMAILWMVS